MSQDCLKKEVDSSNSNTEKNKELRELKETAGKKKFFSKDPYTNHRMLVRSLRHQVVNLAKQIKQLEDLVGLQTIRLCKLDKRMTLALKSLVRVFEEQLEKQSEQNAKTSFF